MKTPNPHRLLGVRVTDTAVILTVTVGHYRRDLNGCRLAVTGLLDGLHPKRYFYTVPRSLYTLAKEVAVMPERITATRWLSWRRTSDIIIGIPDGQAGTGAREAVAEARRFLARVRDGLYDLAEEATRPSTWLPSLGKAEIETCCIGYAADLNVIISLILGALARLNHPAGK